MQSNRWLQTLVVLLVIIASLFLAGLVFAFSVVLRVLPGWAGLGGGIPTYALAVVLSARFRTRTG